MFGGKGGELTKRITARDGKNRSFGTVFLLLGTGLLTVFSFVGVGGFIYWFLELVKFQ